MSEIQQPVAMASSPSLGRPATHRQILAGLDEVGGDKDVTTDEELDTSEVLDDGGDVGSIIGVSIGQAQDHMKSARTPAFEKAQALEQSHGYFEPENIEEGDDNSGSVDVNKGSDGVFEKKQDPVTPPWTPQPEQAKRSSITRTLLNSAQASNRPRSSSGPTAILDGIRKLFTDFQPYPGFGSNLKEEVSVVNGRNDTRQNASDSLDQQVPSQLLVQTRVESQNKTRSPSKLSPLGQQVSRPQALRRSTSDHSLYLKRAATGASEFDNTTAYATVADMPNSRFKAITDSLADSAIKMPKLPSISFNSPRSPTPRSNSYVTRRNTLMNSSTQADQNSTIPGTAYTPPTEKRNPVLTEALSHVAGDVVVMGGYRGSVLRSADFPHHQLWVPVKVGLNLRKVDLEVGLTHEDEEKMEEKIIPSGILAHIGPIDIARRLLKKIRKCPNAKANQLRLHDYGYDWRLSPHYLSQRLIKFLEGLECNSPDTPPERRGALVIAHSLGGIITRHAVNRRPELFSGVVYAGAPQNCCNILGPLRNGDDVLLSSRVLTAQVNFTLRTSYALLPEDGRCFINKETGERYDVDFFDLESWDEHRLSPCINPALPAYTQQASRKSIVGSITDSISSFTPSLPTKRTSWFSTSTSTPTSQSLENTNSNTSSTSTTSQTLKDKASSAQENIESTARNAADILTTSAKQEVQDSLEPSMKSSSSSKPSVATAVTIPKPQAREYLRRTLGEVKAFKSELAHDAAHQDTNRYPPHAIIYGKSVPTVYGAKVASREAIKCADAFDDLAFAAGDGVVLASAAQLPVGYRCVKGGRVESERGHIGLLGDLEGIGRCVAAVVEGRKRGIGLGLEKGKESVL